VQQVQPLLRLTCCVSADYPTCLYFSIASSRSPPMASMLPARRSCDASDVEAKHQHFQQPSVVALACVQPWQAALSHALTDTKRHGTGQHHQHAAIRMHSASTTTALRGQAAIPYAIQVQLLTSVALSRASGMSTLHCQAKMSATSLGVLTCRSMMASGSTTMEGPLPQLPAVALSRSTQPTQVLKTKVHA
jgi:hypothetical protein